MRLLRECLRDLRRGARPGTMAEPLATPGSNRLPTRAPPGIPPVSPAREKTKRPSTIVDYAVVIFEEEGRSLGGAELTRRIIKRGYESKSKDRMDSLPATIWSETKKPSPGSLRTGKITACRSGTASLASWSQFQEDKARQ